MLFVNILFLNYEYPPLGGGAANATQYLLREYAALGMEVDLVTSSLDGQVHVEEVFPGVRVHRIPVSKRPGTLHHQSMFELLRYTWQGYWYAQGLMHEKKYDVIQAFFGVPCGAMGLALGRRKNIPLITSLRGSDVPGYNQKYRFLYVFLQPLISWVWQKSAYVVANSQGLKELAQQTNPQQAIQVIPNGVDTHHFRPDTSRRPDAEIIITAGATRLTERKGLHLVVDALPGILRRFPSVVFEIMGEGKELENLQQQVKERGVTEHVRFIGRVPQAETVGYYQRASVFVLPSSNEGMSNALLEGLACGLPVVVTDTGGSGELVQNGINGSVIERTSEAIEKACGEILSHPEQASRMAKASRERAEQASWRTVAESYQELYREITTS